MTALVATFVTGCGESGGTESGDTQNWRAIDLCTLADPDQVVQLDNSRTGEEAVQPERSDNDVSNGCAWSDHWRDFLSISMKDRTVPDHESPTHVRYVEIAGRQASVTNEKGGKCSVWLKYRDAEMVINIDPAPSKTDVDLDDRSPISCDTQMPLLSSIVGRVDLP
ncbi:hypothetical protein [Nocardia brevicatena]|uniref:hypothetical protein n=1 Tax=Nocardia brevicatena TaxID=37327 RepID=UPI001C3F1D76|nr:hypothetical protein [Nocardia brevicatena]